jgi:hypothetical protein
MNLQKPSIQIRPACPEDISLIFSFIQRKAEFDRSLGAFSGLLQTNEQKLGKTLFATSPFADVLFAEAMLAEAVIQTVGFALYEFCYSSFAGQPTFGWMICTWTQVCAVRAQEQR